MNDDYLYCESCDTYFDNFKYDCLEDAGHDTCKVRSLSKKELLECVEDCKEMRCEE